MLTDKGFQDFTGIADRGVVETMTLTFSNESSLTVTHGHRFFTEVLEDSSVEIEARELKIGSEIVSLDGFVSVLTITYNKPERVYDLVEAGVDRRYITSRILSHNCEMLSSDQLLVDTRVLSMLPEQQPVIAEYNDFKFWKKLQAEQTYIITVDPSAGTGLDFSVIDVYHFPSLEQIAQFRNNTMSSPLLYSKLSWLLKALQDKMCITYFTIENNGVGDGILSLYQADDNPPESAELISDGGIREGMNTNRGSKLKACVALKELIEAGKIEINSPITVKELKNFVRRGGSYEAQIGATDDTVSCLLLMTRVLVEISSHEMAAFDKLYRIDHSEFFTGKSKESSDFEEYDQDDEAGEDEPMPVLF